jgi:ABC-type Fe3+-siderophore transport system permease subunit
MTSPASPPPAAAGSGATTALVLGLLGFLCCQICAPIAWYLGKRELDAIAAGEAPSAGENNARIGMILGIVGSAILGLSMIWVGTLGFAVVMGLLSNLSRWP